MNGPPRARTFPSPLVLGLGWGVAEAVAVERGALAAPLGAIDHALAIALPIVAAMSVVALAHALALQHSRLAGRARWFAETLVGLALGAWLGSELATGGAMRKLAPGIVFVLGGALGGALAVSAGRVIDRRLARPGLYLGVAIGLVAIERVVLVRRYAFLHAALIGAALLLAILAVVRARPMPIARAQLVALPLCALLLLAAIAGRPVLRALLAEHSRIGGALVSALPQPIAVAGDGATIPRRALAARLAMGPSVLPRLPSGAARVVLLTIDAWRADRLSATATPRLWALAQHGVCFDRAYTATPHTSLALASLHTGRDAAARSASTPLDPRTPLLAEAFGRAGWQTAAFYPPAVFTIEPERTRAIEQARFGFQYVKQQFSTAAARTQEVRAYLDEVAPTRALIWVHYFEPHEPYDAHGDATATSARARYDREVAYVDREIGELLEGLGRDGTPTWIVLAADHGEEFGEHGGRYHGTSLYEEQVRVPLCVAQLGSVAPARRVQAPASLVDVMPTLLAALGVGLDLDGDGLVLSLDDDAGARGGAFVTLGAARAVIDGDWKLVVSRRTGGQALYDLRRDPDERSNRALAEPAIVARLLTALTAYAAPPLASEAERQREGRLARAELGDAAARRELAAELPELQEPLATRVARLLVERGGAPSIAMPGPAGRWLQVATLRSGGVAPSWLAPECATGDAALCSAAALALRSPPWLAIALARRDGEEATRLGLVVALGKSGDPAALDPLLLALAEVRLRRVVVEAIDTLDDYRSIGSVARWAPHEPYADVRAAMVKYLVRVSRRDPSGAAHAALAQLRATEQEPAIRLQLGLDSASTQAR